MATFFLERDTLWQKCLESHHLRKSGAAGEVFLKAGLISASSEADRLWGGGGGALRVSSATHRFQTCKLESGATDGEPLRR